MAKKTIDEVIAELKEELRKLGITDYDRQHGRAATVLSDPEAEKRRIRGCLASQLSRAKKRVMYKEIDNSVKGIDKIKGESGITAIDERRYKKCFVYENILPELDYIQRMTGCDINQIQELEKRTGLKYSKASSKTELSH